jgi:hypothetical protein
MFLDFPELAGKWLELLRESVPRLSRVAILWDSGTDVAQQKAIGSMLSACAHPVNVLGLGHRPARTSGHGSGQFGPGIAGTECLTSCPRRR